MKCPNQIENRDVYIFKRSKTQTVKICTSDNQRGKYDPILRLPVRKAVTCDDLIQFNIINDLVKWLVETREAQKEKRPKQIENRNVRIRKGPKNQTVSICTSDNKWGVYDLTLRLPVGIPITYDDIGKYETIDKLVDWLVSEHGAKKEIAVQPPDGVEVNILEPALKQAEAEQYIDYTPNDDTWIAKAVKITESCIDELLEEFLECPYLHRVEHSLHTRLYELLHSRPHFDRHFQSKSGSVYQPIHKEWPESKARPKKGDRRGNYDFAILCPGQFASCGKDPQFRRGLIVPPIAIEMGLDYDMSHLRGDADKLDNSKINHGYLIHLVRFTDQVDRARQAIEELKSKTPRIKIAFAQVYRNTKHIKLLNEAIIRTP